MSDAKLSAEERLDIQELFARYCWGLNTGNIDQVLSCFTEDGALVHPPQGRCQGEEAIRTLLDELWYGRPSWFIGRQHLATQFLFEKTAEGVQVKAYWTITQKDVDSGRTYIYALGHWDNLCVIERGAWRFRVLEVTIWGKETVPWVGEDRAVFHPTIGRMRHRMWQQNRKRWSRSVSTNTTCALRRLSTRRPARTTG